MSGYQRCYTGARWVLGVSLLISGSVLAQTSTRNAPLSSGQEVGNSEIVTLDPVTHKLRPATADEINQLKTSVAQSRTFVNGAPLPRNEAEALTTLRPLPHGGYIMRMPESLVSPLGEQP
ncbi:hypothetical protein [Paraburkholderia acidicola]|uniref:hypothetical protein n=1 Tax=Paraburkholderia acidicola TaxID=1912599 RepID=UPI0010568CE1|nr:hypothetical protein [Paraburkholderia acidicola]